MESEWLRKVIERDGRVEGPLLKVDTFLNHRVEPSLMASIGADLADRFAADEPQLVLTAEASGIPPALATSLVLDVPMVYAKKYPHVERPSDALVRTVASPTKGVSYRIEVARHVLPSETRVLVVDDFLSGGRTAVALGEIVEEAGATLVGFGFVIEKAFLGGRAPLTERGWRVESLIRVAALEPSLVID